MGNARSAEIEDVSNHALRWVGIPDLQQLILREVCKWFSKRIRRETLPCATIMRPYGRDYLHLRMHELSASLEMHAQTYILSCGEISWHGTLTRASGRYVLVRPHYA